MQEPSGARRKTSADQAIIDMIEQNIRERVWLPGDRLPTERELAATFGSSRNTLRRGLKILEAEGKITRHVGRGSYVSADLVAEEGNGLFPQPQRRPLFMDFVRRASPVEIMEVRSMIEPAAAAMAAVRATREDLDLMERYLREADAAQDLETFEEIDALLHMRIVLSTRNRLLSDIYHEINTARIEPAWKELKSRRLTRPQRERYHADHHGVVNAITNRDADLARSLSKAHLAEAARDLFELE